MVLLAIICLMLINVKAFAELSLVKQEMERKDFVRLNAFNGLTPIRYLKWKIVAPIQGRWLDSLDILSVCSSR